MHLFSVSPKGYVARACIQARTWLPDCQGVSALPELGCGGQWGQPQIPAGQHKCFSTYPDSARTYSHHPPLACHRSSCRINPFTTVQRSMQRVKGQDSGVTTRQTNHLSSAQGPLRILPASIQMVSVLGRRATPVWGREGWIPWTRSIPHSLSTCCKDCHGKRGRGQCVSFSTKPNSACVSGDSGQVGRELPRCGSEGCQRRGLNHGRDAWMEHSPNLPLDRKGSSYFDALFLPESTLTPTPEQCCIYG